MNDSLQDSIQNVHQHVEDVVDLCCLLVISDSDRAVACVRALTELAAWHLDTEEEFLLPEFAKVEDQYPASSRTEHIKADHERIGESLERIIDAEGAALLRALRKLHHQFAHHHVRESQGLQRFVATLDAEDGSRIQDHMWESFPIGLEDALAGAIPVIVLWHEHVPPPAVSADVRVAVQVAIHQLDGFIDSVLRSRPREEWVQQLIVLTGDVLLSHADGMPDPRTQRLLRGQVRKLRTLVWKMRQSVQSERMEDLGGNGLLQAIDRSETALRVLKHIQRTLDKDIHATGRRF